MQYKSWNAPLGRTLCTAALIFGAVGLVIGLKANHAATAWFFAAVVLGISAGAVMVDELRPRDMPDDGYADVWVGTICLLGGLAAGAIGFILGLRGDAYASTWSMASIVLALLAAGAAVDELRMVRSGDVDFASALGVTLATFTFFLGVFGFILGLSGQATAQPMFLAAIVIGITTLSGLFGADRGAVAHRSRAGRSLPHRPRKQGALAE